MVNELIGREKSEYVRMGVWELRRLRQFGDIKFDVIKCLEYLSYHNICNYVILKDLELIDSPAKALLDTKIILLRESVYLSALDECSEKYVNSRFIIAHEIGHIWLHSNKKQVAFDDHIEAEANMFALELLAPIEYVAHSLNENQFLSGGIQKYNKTAKIYGIDHFNARYQRSLAIEGLKTLGLNKLAENLHKRIRFIDNWPSNLSSELRNSEVYSIFNLQYKGMAERHVDSSYVSNVDTETAHLHSFLGTQNTKERDCRVKTIYVKCSKCGKTITMHLDPERVTKMYYIEDGVKHYYTMEKMENDIKNGYNLCENCDDK
jgi:predicted SprT family Zn-dependent metalloprotease